MLNPNELYVSVCSSKNPIVRNTKKHWWNDGKPEIYIPNVFETERHPALFKTLWDGTVVNAEDVIWLCNWSGNYLFTTIILSGETIELFHIPLVAPQIVCKGDTMRFYPGTIKIKQRYNSR